MKNIKKPKIVLFDLDNTLYEYNSSHNEALNSVKLKVKNLLNIEENEFNLLYDEAKKIIKKQIPETASSHNRLLYFQKLIELKGLGQQVLISLDLNQTYWNKFLISSTLHDGVIEVLEELRINGVKLGLVTDLTADIQFRKLIKFELEHYFDSIVTSEEIGLINQKDCFRIAVNKFHNNDSKNMTIWMIGDDEIKDIKGAKDSINAIGILFQNKKTKGYKYPDFVFSDYYVLLNKIQNVFK